MNQSNLALIIEQYVDRFDELNASDGYDEGYKWRAVSCFKRYWDIEAEDFPEMFRLAMSETSNLIDNKTVQPIGGISNLLKNADEVEFVRDCFRALFSEDGGDLSVRQNRIERFMERINSRINKYHPGTWKYPQAFNNVLYYLNLWRPEENYIYKATEAIAWADCIGFEDDFGSGTTFSLEKYYMMCDELLAVLPGYDELMQRHNERFARAADGFDDELHILVYDILYCAYHYGFYTGMTRLLNGMIPNFYEGKLEGEVLLDGKNLLEFPMYEISKRVGSVFQNPRTQFYTVNTTSELAFGCENLGMEPSEIARRIEQAARDLQIEYLLNRNIFNLSGGEKQIIAFASVYAMSPQIYVLDEPSSNLDIQAVEKVRKILSLLKQQGKTIIIAEHRTYYLKDLVDRAVYMENGKIVQEYTMSELAHLSHEEQLHSGIRTVDLLSYPITPRLLPSTSHTIEIADIHCFYGQTEALSIPKLSIPSGRITAIIGTNGAGKSTFISWMCGLMKKAKGTFMLDGNRQNAKERVRESYLVMQEVNHQLFSDSVREEIVLGNRDSSENRLHEIMEALDILGLSERHPMTLSGGQKQRVIIASAMFCGKRILYFDEPTSGLDFSHMMQTCQLLKQLQREDVFLFIITHDYELIASICDSVIHIEQGRLLEQYDLDAAGFQKLKMFFTQCLENRL